MDAFAGGMLSGSVQHAIISIAGELARFKDQATDPEDALAAIRAVGRRANLEVDLVWDENDLTKEVAYDVFVTVEDLGTFSLSLTPRETTPWPLRGALSANERDILRVNGEKRSVEQVVSFLDFMWSNANVMRSVLDECLTAEAVRRHDVRTSEEHMRRAWDRFRARHRLVDDSAIQEWSAQNGMTVPQLTEHVARAASQLALEDAVLRPRANLDRVGQPNWLATTWQRLAGGFDLARVVRLRTKNPEDAARFAQTVARGGVHAFYDLVESQLASGKLAGIPGGAIGAVMRRDLPDDYAEAIFDASPGDTIGPLRITTTAGEVYDLVRVTAIVPANLDDPATRERVTAIAFEEWLSERRKSAEIEWFWGSVEQTRRASVT